MPSVPLVRARPSLAAEHERLDAGGRQRRPGRRPPPGAVDHLTFPGEGQGDMGQRSQVAAAAQRSVFADDGRDPGVQQGDQAVHQVRPDP